MSTRSSIRKSGKGGRKRPGAKSVPPRHSLHEKRLETLLRVSQDVLAADTIEEVLQRVVDAARELTGGRIGTSGHRYREGSFLIGASSRGRDAPACPPGQEFCVARGGVYMDLLEKKISIRLSDKQLRRHRAWWGLPEGHAPLRGLLGARLVEKDGKANGVIMVSDKRDGEFTAEDEALLVQLASLASLGLRHIEARREAEQWAHERAAVFAAMADAVIVFDGEGNPLQANPAARELLGVRLRTKDLIPALRKVRFGSSDGGRLPAEQTPLARALGGEVVENERLLMTDARGKETVVLVSASPVIADGEVTRVVLVIRDISEMEEANQQLLASEQRFRHAIREAPYPIMLHAEDGEILDVNKAWVKQSGYTREGIPAISRWLERAFDEKRDEVKRHLERSCKTTDTIRLGECTITAEDGRKRLWEVYSSGLGTLRGGRRVAVTMAVDLTEGRQAEDALRNLRQRLKADLSFAGIVGRDPKMLELYDTIRELAEVDAPVLILGESGTGKELVANAIHNEGHRVEKRFIAVSCGALPETLLESELFGHVRGAFTGAIRDKMGRFELANGGTIFLDEIGEISPTIQVKLLRVLQEGAFERVGDEKTVEVDVRIISATNRNLEEEIAAGRFREDLYYRLCVIPVTLPPLRERRGDIPLLANHILKQALREQGGKDVMLAQDALALMMDHDWPGNVRELENALHYALVKCKDDVLRARHLPPQLQPKNAVRPRRAKRAKEGGAKPPLSARIVSKALREARGNKTMAARKLGVSRVTLYRYLDRDGTSGAAKDE